MATQETKKEVKTENESNRKGKLMAGLKSAGWLLETVARGLAGYIILTNFSNKLAIGVGVYFTATGAVLLITHFAKAYVK